jgi:hypothetical protein
MTGSCNLNSGSGSMRNPRLGFSRPYALECLLHAQGQVGPVPARALMTCEKTLRRNRAVGGANIETNFN